MTFYQGSTTLGTVPVTPVGLASINLPQLASTYAIGTHTFTATYSGDSNFIGSTSPPFSQVVAPPIFTSDGLGCDFSVVNSATNAVTNYPESASTTCTTYASNFLAVSPDGTHAYLMQPTATATTIKVINTATAGVIGTISLPADAMDLAMAPNGADLYVAERYANQVAVISTATDAVVRNIASNPGSGGFVWALAINPAGTELAVAEYSGIQFVNLHDELRRATGDHLQRRRRRHLLALGIDGLRGVRQPLHHTGEWRRHHREHRLELIHARLHRSDRTLGAGRDTGRHPALRGGPGFQRSAAVPSASSISPAAPPPTRCPTCKGFTNITVSLDGTKVYAANEGGSVTVLNASSHAQPGPSPASSPTRTRCAPSATRRRRHHRPRRRSRLPRPASRSRHETCSTTPSSARRTASRRIPGRSPGVRCRPD